MNPEPLFPDGGRVGVEGLKDRSIMPGRRLMGRFAIVQEDPCPVSLTDACVDVRRFKIKLSGADDGLVLPYDGHRRHIHLQGVRSSGSPSLLYHHVIQGFPSEIGSVIGHDHASIGILRAESRYRPTWIYCILLSKNAQQHTIRVCLLSNVPRSRPFLIGCRKLQAGSSRCSGPGRPGRPPSCARLSRR